MFFKDLIRYQQADQFKAKLDQATPPTKTKIIRNKDMDKKINILGNIFRSTYFDSR